MLVNSLYHPPRIHVVPEKSTEELLYLSHEFEGKQLVRDFIPETLMGVGYLWGGLYDPWGKSGMAAAVLNLFLFGGWACVESLALVCARNLLRVRSRSWLVAAGATGGGLWVGLFSALHMSANPVLPGSLVMNMVCGLIAGLLMGIGISALCTITLSSMMLGAVEEHGSVSEPSHRQGLSLAWKVIIGFSVGCILLGFLVLTALAFLFI